MSTPPIDPRVVAAQAKAEAARARLNVTVGEIKLRVSPRSLAQDAAVTFKDNGLALVETAQRKPATFAAVAAGVVLLLARRRIIRLFRATPAPPESSSSAPESKKGSAR